VYTNYYINTARLQVLYGALGNQLMRVSQNHPPVRENENVTNYIADIYNLAETGRQDVTTLLGGHGSAVVSTIEEYYDAVSDSSLNLFWDVRTSLSPNLTRCYPPQNYNFSIALLKAYIQLQGCYITYITSYSNINLLMSQQLSLMEIAMAGVIGKLWACTWTWISDDAAVACVNDVVSNSSKI
jgi:hypothetical protein